MGTTERAIGILTAGAMLALPVGAYSQEAARAAPLAKLAACRAVTDDTARLACFDREVAAFEGAVKDKQVAVVDRGEIRKTRRSLFGIPLPRIALFDDNDDEPEIKEIVGTIKSVGRNSDGGVLFTLEDGAVWSQTDDWPVYSAVKPGQKVTLKRGALGAFFADFEKAVTVKAKRLR